MVMRVLFISSGRDGGPGNVVRNQGESLETEGVRLHYFLVQPGLAGYLKAIIRLRKYYRQGGFDLAHAHYSLCGFIAGLARCKPLVVSLMGSDVYGSRTARLLIRLFSATVWTETVVKSRDMKERLKLKRAWVIPNGVDITRFYPLPREVARTRIGFPEKGKLVVMAADPGRPEKNTTGAEDAVRELENVEFRLLSDIPGSEMPWYLNAADVLLLTSKWEGSPNIIKEAMACCCPVVTTDVGDVRWVMGDTEGCYVTTSEVPDISEKIGAALKFGKRTDGNERIRQLGLDSKSVALRLIDLYRNSRKDGMPELEVLTDDRIPADKWQEFVESNRHGSPFQTRAFYDICNEVPGFRATAVAVSRYDRIESLAMAVIQKERGIKSRFTRRAVIYGGPLLGEKSHQADAVLLSALVSGLKRKAIYIESRNYSDYAASENLFSSRGWMFIPYLNMTVSTGNKSLEELLAGMNYNRRRQIRLSLEEGASYGECDSENELAELHSILADLYANEVRLPLPDYSFFRLLWLKDPGKVFVVRHNNRVIGGSICLVQPGRAIYTMYHCGLRHYARKIYPTHLAVLAAMDYAVNNNLQKVDLMGAGIKGREYGVRVYKKEFGGIQNEYGRFRFVSDRVLYATGKILLSLYGMGKRVGPGNHSSHTR